MILDVPDAPGYSFFGVFDGHGGADTSEYLSVTLPQRCSASIKSLDDLNDGEGILLRVIDEFIRIDQEQVPPMKHQYMGSTGTICVITSSIVTIVNVGDSPAILFERSGNILAMSSIDDCENPDEFTRINADATRPLCEYTYSHQNRRLSLGRYPNGSLDKGLDMTRAFGDNAYKPKSDAIPSNGQVWARKSGDILCVCSDSFLERSLTTYIPQTIPEIVGEILPCLQRNNFNLPTSIQEIITQRVTRIYGDNTTMILVKL